MINRKFDFFRLEMKEKAPYYPKVKEVIRDWESFEYKTERQNAINDIVKFIGIPLSQTETKTQVTSRIIAITSIVRHEHKGIWYARHHLLTRILSMELLVNIDKKWNKLREEFRHQVYLDLKFGEIYPDFNTGSNEPLDPEDKLQISEKERLNL